VGEYGRVLALPYGHTELKPDDGWCTHFLGKKIRLVVAKTTNGVGVHCIDKKIKCPAMAGNMDVGESIV
jgi:hypothetical protein